MKYLCFLLIILSLNKILFSQRNLPTIDHFDYGLGELRTAGNDWSRISGSSNDLLVVDSNLTYTGYPMPSTGKRVKLSAGGADDCKLSISQLSNNGDKIYASFLVNVENLTGLTTSGAYFAALGNGTNIFLTRLWIRLDNDNDGFNLGLSKNSNTVAGWSSKLNINQTYLVVLYYEIVSGTSNDIAKIWINPDLSGSEPTPDLSTSSNNDSYIDGFYLRQANGTPNVYIDALRIGTSWNDAPLPVELTFFNALSKSNYVNLVWKTATEVNNYGWEIERSKIDEKTNKPLVWEKVGFVKGSGNSNSPKEYSFIDTKALYGYYAYRLRQIDVDGSASYSSEVRVFAGSKPQVYAVKNYPNPFNPQTTIRFELPEAGNVKLAIYDITGQLVKVLVDEWMPEGIHETIFDGSQLASGIYISVLQAKDVQVVKKMQLIK